MMMALLGRKVGPEAVDHTVNSMEVPRVDLEKEVNMIPEHQQTRGR